VSPRVAALDESPAPEAPRDSAKSSSATDSLSHSLRDAIEKVSTIFDVPDSVVKGLTTHQLVDVDSTSGVTGDAEPTWDIDVNSYVTEEKVARYVTLFLGSSRTRFVERLQRGKQYEGLIRQTFRSRGIPEDMYYLALVESGYEPHAYSRAAAVGMWQFMTTTARGVGLRVDWWVDERRDPVRSTAAAARFIGELRSQFGSLYLAAAAYNGGPGRVSRGLRKFDGALEDVSGEDCFFALAEQDYLRTETKNYVPQLIAAALIGKAPQRYGITLDSVPAFAYDSAFVPPSTPVAAVARAAGVSVREVQLLNPHLLRGLTPPDTRVAVRVPVGRAVSFDSLFAALDSADRRAFTRTTPRKSESLSAFAKRHGVQVRHLQWYNRKIAVRKGRLVAGQTLLVPTSAVVQAAFDVPDPSIERYGTAPVTRSGRTTHIVRRGETLGTIAKRYGTSVATLVRLNGLKKNVIYAGQSIIVRGSASARRTSTARPASSRPSAARKPSASAAKPKAGTSKPTSSARKPTSPVRKPPAASKAP